MFDNAEDPADVPGWLPGGAGHVLITSRARGWAEVAVPVEVDVLARAESVAILQDRVPGLGTADADRLAAAAGGPAAGRRAGRRVHGRDRHAAAEYLGLLRTRAAKLLDQGAPVVLSAVAGSRDPAGR